MRFIRRDGTIIDMTPPKVTRHVRCSKCGHTAPYDEWPKGHDFFQKSYIRKCLNPDCDNQQSPGNASMRMFDGVDHPFEFVQPKRAFADPLDQVLHNAEEAS